MASPTDEKMRESHLRWFDHMQNREINTLVKRNNLVQVK